MKGGEIYEREGNLNTKFVHTFKISSQIAISGVSASRRSRETDGVCVVGLRKRARRVPAEGRPPLLRQEQDDGPQEGHQPSLPHRVSADGRRRLLSGRRRPRRDLRQDESPRPDVDGPHGAEPQDLDLQSDDADARHHPGFLRLQGGLLIPQTIHNETKQDSFHLG